MLSCVVYLYIVQSRLYCLDFFHFNFWWCLAGCSCFKKDDSALARPLCFLLSLARLYLVLSSSSASSYSLHSFFHSHHCFILGFTLFPTFYSSSSSANLSSLTPTLAQRNPVCRLTVLAASFSHRNESLCGVCVTETYRTILKPSFDPFSYSSVRASQLNPCRQTPVSMPLRHRWAR